MWRDVLKAGAVLAGVAVAAAVAVLMRYAGPAIGEVISDVRAERGGHRG